MRRLLALLLVPAAVATVVLVGAAAPAAAAGERLVDIGVSFETPLLATAPEGEDDVFVVERAGLVRQVAFGADGQARSVTTFADLRDLVGTDGEGGLLGLAFSPDYAADGRVWLSYTDLDGDSVVARYERNSAGTRIDVSTRATVIEVDQPTRRHKGGMIAFAPDGMLLLGLGDGATGGDPLESGQDTSTLLGSILRIDVVDQAGDGYGVPPDNPFVGSGEREEIWAYGVRNPYRFSVDRDTGDVWIGDVGENTREEVNRLPYEPSVAVNLGWDRYEGSTCFEECGNSSGLTFPVHEYGHSAGACSVTGGYVVRGDTAPDLDGRYVFGDFCAGFVEVYDPRTDRTTRLADDVGRVYGFGQDGFGTTYVLTGSRVLRVADSGTSFEDVAAESVFAEVIEAIADEGITKGCNPPANTRFCPRGIVTREQMAAFIVRADDLPGARERFRDVAATNVFARDIGGIAAAGITRGCNPPANDRFCPSRDITRGEMAALLVRALDLAPARERFRDVVASDVFAADIGAIAAAGITKGCNPPANDRYCPDDPVTREQMAAFIARAWDL